MFLYGELHTITHTLMFSFFPRTKVFQKALTNILNIPNQGYQSIYQLKTEVQTMVYQNT